jgi:hypothetical protein
LLLLRAISKYWHHVLALLGVTICRTLNNSDLLNDSNSMPLNCSCATDDLATQNHLPFVLILRTPNFLPISSLPARSLLYETQRHSYTQACRLSPCRFF